MRKLLENYKNWWNIGFVLFFFLFSGISTFIAILVKKELYYWTQSLGDNIIEPKAGGGGGVSYLSQWLVWK